MDAGVEDDSVFSYVIMTRGREVVQYNETGRACGVCMYYMKEE